MISFPLRGLIMAKQVVSDPSVQLRELEEESRALLAALRWSSTVRNIILIGLILFVVVFGFLLWNFYQDWDRRFAEIQRVATARQDEFLQPITQQVYALAQDTWPHVQTVVRTQVENDMPRYQKVFEKEWETMRTNLAGHIESSLFSTYESMIRDHEKILQEEFPELLDEARVNQFRINMEVVYRELAKRYYSDYFRAEFDRLVYLLNTFPAVEPDASRGATSEQIVSGMLDVVRMLIAQAHGSGDEFGGAPVPATSTPGS